MSRQIDTSNPEALSLEDRIYLQDRGQLPEGAEPVSREEMESLTTQPVANYTGDVNTVPDDVNTGSGPNDKGAVEASEDEDLPEYEDMTKDELLAEVEKRGLEVPKSSTKGEIIAALDEDDEQG